MSKRLNRPLAPQRAVDSIMVDSWEVEQRQYTRTLFVLQRVERALQELFGAGQTPAPAEASGAALGPRSVPMVQAFPGFASPHRARSPALQPAAGACPPVVPRVMLVCGADVLHSMADPSLWRQDLLEVGGRLPAGPGSA